MNLRTLTPIKIIQDHAYDENTALTPD